MIVLISFEIMIIYCIDRSKIWFFTALHVHAWKIWLCNKILHSCEIPLWFPCVILHIQCRYWHLGKITVWRMFVQYVELFGGLHYTLCLLDSSLWPNATVLVITVRVSLRDTLMHCTGWFLSWHLIIHTRNHCIIFLVFITLPSVMCFLVVERVS